jgi:hypothetical protein
MIRRIVTYHVQPEAVEQALGIDRPSIRDVALAPAATSDHSP